MNKRKPAKSEKETPKEERRESCPIIGIGASAGGLEALEQFLSHVPVDCGFAFVVIQHLDPTQRGILVELLQKTTRMTVVQIKDRMQTEPNHVYVIPSNKDLSILRGVLHLLEPAAPRGLRLPIDFFFRSLAEDQQEKSIGVILSGMGSDGTLGLRAIKEKAGAVFVQSPNTAKFDSMPRTAMDAGLADVVAAPDILPAQIANYLLHTPLLAKNDQIFDDQDPGSLEKVVILLRAQTGHDFSLYKKSTIYRRIERRMGLHQIGKISDYVRYLRENSQESDLLFKELLIGVTNFFRDPSVWEELKQRIIPDMLAAHPKGGTLRAWTVGCSTGEEAYSLAMVFKEAQAEVRTKAVYSLKIFATDLDKDAIDQARAGLYPPNIAADVSDERLDQFFVRDEHGAFTVKKEIREMVIFAPQNMVMHPPFTRLDLVTCRNLLIYLEPELQRKIMPLFHYSLNSGGILVLGSAETVGTATDLFAPLSGKARIYRRLDTIHPPGLIDFPVAFAGGRPRAKAEVLPVVSSPNLQTLADQLILQRFSPPAVLVTNEGDILYITGKTGRYLEPAAGKANWNLFAMARNGLGNALTEGFHKALREKSLVVLKHIEMEVSGGTSVEITIQPLTSPASLEGMVMVLFTEERGYVRSSPKAVGQTETMSKSRLIELTLELQEAHRELQCTRGEMQSTQEELKSTNEELQSMNEELQSTIEELTTSKEEMQSINEELTTMNHDLQAKVDELSEVSNDMKNLLNSTDIATIFLDDELRIRRYTNQATKIVRLIPTDVGRPVTDIVTTLDYSDLEPDTLSVLKNHIPVEKEVTGGNGRWFIVRIMPNRLNGSQLDGVVITFTDITVAKKLEADLRKVQSELERRLSEKSAELGKALEQAK